MCLIDNKGVLAALLSCKASAAYFEPILDFITSWEVSKGVCPWFERVSSSANIADGPSSGCNQLLRGVAQSEFVLDGFLDRVAQGRDCPRG